MKTNSTHNTNARKTNKQYLYNYLIVFKYILEAALIAEKRPKPRSDIEDAMFVVNNDVRKAQRNKQYKQLKETAGRGRAGAKILYRDVSRTERHVQTHQAYIYTADISFI